MYLRNVHVYLNDAMRFAKFGDYLDRASAVPAFEQERSIF